MIRLWLLFLICCTDVQVPVTVPPLVMEHLKALSRELELWERPDGWGAFDSEIGWHRYMYAQVHDAPSLSQIQRFPKGVAQQYVHFNREHKQWLEIRGYCTETADWSYRVWYAVHDAVDSPNCMAVRRKALKELRELLGEEAFWSGQLPDAVLWERFRRIE